MNLFPLSIGLKSYFHTLTYLTPKRRFSCFKDNGSLFCLLMKKYFLLQLLISFSFLSSAQKIDSLVYTRGGGATGKLHSYKYTPNSVSFSQGKLQLNYIQIKRLKKSEWKKIASKSTMLLSSESNFYRPANYYKSLIIYSGDKTVKYFWDASDKNIPVDLDDLIKYLEKYQLHD